MKVCEQAIRALDAKACGVFFVDIKESDERASPASPRSTPAGSRRSPTSTIWSGSTIWQRRSFASPSASASGSTGASDFAEGYYLVRSVDTLPAVLHKHELFEGIEDSEA